MHVMYVQHIRLDEEMCNTVSRRLRFFCVYECNAIYFVSIKCNVMYSINITITVT